jgi:4'-phosphopantetheinyl transferase
MLSHWDDPEGYRSLKSGEVHLWRVRLDLPDDVALARSWLTSDESARAERFRRPDDRRRWVTSRLWLRRLLGGYLGIDPGELQLVGGMRDKPTVRAIGREPVYFNVSHCAEFALFAFCCDEEVGVDVEQFRADVDVEGISARIFGDEATQLLRAVPESQRIARFTWMWVEHEAAVKCRGTGLDERQWPEVSGDLWIAEVHVANEFAAAVARPSPPGRVLMWDPQLRAPT